jgi:hypothetical protein
LRRERTPQLLTLERLALLSPRAGRPLICLIVSVTGATRIAAPSASAAAITLLDLVHRHERTNAIVNGDDSADADLIAFKPRFTESARVFPPGTTRDSFRSPCFPC